MARRRFFVSEVRRGSAELTGSDAEHLVRVLRVQAGQVFEICDNTDVYLAEVETARKAAVTFRCLEKLPVIEPPVLIHLLPALFKFDHFEWLIEKTTELGVVSIQPFEAVRTEKGLREASHKRLTRWQRIGVEASQQSRRVHLPEIDSAQRLSDVLSFEADCKLMLDEETGCPALLDCLPEQKKPEDAVAILLGPEGGWTEEERAQVKAAGWQSCSLGPTILRAETAAIAAAAIVSAAWMKAGNQS